MFVRFLRITDITERTYLPLEWPKFSGWDTDKHNYVCHTSGPIVKVPTNSECAGWQSSHARCKGKSYIAIIGIIGNPVGRHMLRPKEELISNKAMPII